MIILYLITQADGGGAQKYVLTLAKHFRGIIAAGNEAQKLFDDAKKAGLNVYRLKRLKRNINPWHDCLAVWEIRKLIKQLNPDIVHLNSSKAGVIGSFACIGLKPKVIFTAHGFIFNEPLSLLFKFFYLMLEKLASKFRDYIICVSQADLNSAIKRKLIHANKISVIHNGINQIDFLARDKAKNALNLPQNKKVIGVIANNYKTKGVDILLDAFNMQPKPDAILTIIGRHPSRTNAQQNVFCLDFIENAAKYLKAFDILVIPSRKEGFPFVALEAMQAGLPIVAANVGGIPEALGDVGLLIPAENAEALAAAIQQIIANDNLKQLLSQKALERSKLFTEEKMLSNTLSIYKTFCKISF